MDTIDTAFGKFPSDKVNLISKTKENFENQLDNLYELFELGKVPFGLKSGQAETGYGLLSHHISIALRELIQTAIEARKHGLAIPIEVTDLMLQHFHEKFNDKSIQTIWDKAIEHDGVSASVKKLHEFRGLIRDMIKGHQQGIADKKANIKKKINGEFSSILNSTASQSIIQPYDFGYLVGYRQKKLGTELVKQYFQKKYFKGRTIVGEWFTNYRLNIDIDKYNNKNSFFPFNAKAPD